MTTESHSKIILGQSLVKLSSCLLVGKQLVFFGAKQLKLYSTSLSRCNPTLLQRDIAAPALHPKRHQTQAPIWYNMECDVHLAWSCWRGHPP